MTYLVSIDTTGWTLEEKDEARHAAHRLIFEAGLYINNQPWARWVDANTLAVDCASVDPTAVLTGAAVLQEARDAITSRAAAAAAEAALDTDVQNELRTSVILKMSPLDLETAIRQRLAPGVTGSLTALRTEVTRLLIDLARGLAVVARKV